MTKKNDKKSIIIGALLILIVSCLGLFLLYSIYVEETAEPEETATPTIQTFVEAIEPTATNEPTVTPTVETKTPLPTKAPTEIATPLPTATRKSTPAPTIENTPTDSPLSIELQFWCTEQAEMFSSVTVTPSK